MASWQEIYFNGCEEGFHDVKVDGIPQTELTIPNKMSLHWLDGNNQPGLLHRPEMDMKKDDQSEIFDGLFSATGFVINSTGRFGLVTDPIPVEIGKKIVGVVKYMHVFTDQGGQAMQGGSRLGIVTSDDSFIGGPKWTVDPFEHPDIKWGSWRGIGDTENRKWVTLATPEVMPNGPFVRLVVQFNADFATSFSSAHWDNWILYQYTEGTEPPSSDLGSQLRDIVADLSAIESNLIRIASEVDDLGGNAEVKVDVEEARDLLNNALGKL